MSIYRVSSSFHQENAPKGFGRLFNQENRNTTVFGGYFKRAEQNTTVFGSYSAPFLPFIYYRHYFRAYFVHILSHNFLACCAVAHLDDVNTFLRSGEANAVECVAGHFDGIAMNRRNRGGYAGREIVDYTIGRGVKTVLSRIGTSEREAQR